MVTTTKSRKSKKKTTRKTTGTKAKTTRKPRAKAREGEPKPSKSNPEIPSPFSPPGSQRPELLPQPDDGQTPRIEEIASGIAGVEAFKAPSKQIGPVRIEAEGAIGIPKRVLARIACLASEEIPGLAPPRNDPVSRLTGTIQGRTDGIRVDIGTTEAAVDMLIRVQYGTDIPALTSRLREAISRRIWEMTGLRVVQVNIRIQDIIPAAQLEPLSQDGS